MNTKYGKNHFVPIKNNSKIIHATFHIYWLHSGAWKATNITKCRYSVNWYLTPTPPFLILVLLSDPTISYQSGSGLIAQCSVPDEPRSRGAGYLSWLFSWFRRHKSQTKSKCVHKLRMPSSHRGSNPRTTCVHLPSSQELKQHFGFQMLPPLFTRSL